MVQILVRGDEFMNDSEDDLDLGKFEDDDGDIRPIDIAGAVPGRPSGARRAQVPEKPAGEELLVDDSTAARNFVKQGDFIDLLKLVPSLKEISVGVGWELKNVESDKIDVDLSCFLIDKTGQTRVDEDFVFYNQISTLEGAVRHLGDSRTGDGEGDDEALFIDLNGIPFDVVRIALVLSIYDDMLKGWHFGMVKDLFLRLVDSTEGRETLRVDINEEHFQAQTAILVGCLVREGPKWFFEALEKPVPGGLMAAAGQYGIIVREDTG